METPKTPDGWGVHPQPVEQEKLTYFRDGAPVARIEPTHAGEWQAVVLGPHRMILGTPRTSIGNPVATQEQAREVVEIWIAETDAALAIAEKVKADRLKPNAVGKGPVKPPPDEPVDSLRVK